MTETLDREDWGPPFPAEEYGERVRRVKEEMASRQIDTLIVTSPPNITYLCGYDSIWYDLGVVTAFVIRVDQDPAFFIDSTYHRELVRLTAEAPEVVFHGGKGTRALVGSLTGRGWLSGNVGIERWSRAPAGPTLAEIEERLKDAGANVVDGSWAVDRVKLVKSPREVAYVRKSAEIADAALEEVRRAIGPGMTEKEVAGLAQYAMAKLGGEEPAIRTIVRSGPRSAGHHALPTERKLRRGEVVIVDWCASYKRYHVDLARTFAIGDVDDRWDELLERASHSVEEVVKGVKPGDPMSRVTEIADEYVDRTGLRQHVWWVNGYDLGIAIPPDWVGHTFLGGGRFETANFDAGVLTNYENVLDCTEMDWPGGRGEGYIESLLMTEDGLEILSKVPRTLIQV